MTNRMQEINVQKGIYQILLLLLFSNQRALHACEVATGVLSILVTGSSLVEKGHLQGLNSMTKLFL